MIRTILTYIAVKKIITFVVIVAVMIGLLAVVCIAAAFAPTIASDDVGGPVVAFADTQHASVYTHADGFGGLDAGSTSP